MTSRRRRRAALVAGVLAGVLAVVLAGALAGSAPAMAAGANLRVRGNQLIDGPGRGHVVQLRGVSRSGLEYECIQGNGFFESPQPHRLDSRAMVAAMARWKINVVRVPLNEDCWLGVGTARGLGGRPYQRIVKRYVGELNAAHLYVILDLHLAAPPGSRAVSQLPMADAGLAPQFWRSLARVFRHNHTLLFDLFNEPFSINWPCWRDGCQIPAGQSGGTRWPGYRAAGMQQLVDAMRSTGARQPLLLGGLNYAFDVSRWGAFAPRDPRHELVAAEHNYGVLAPCDLSCHRAIVRVSRRHPVVIGELGETDCKHAYVDRFMPFADSHRISYLAWAWDAGGGWTCTGGPSLIRDYAGDPTPFGSGVQRHLSVLGMPRRPN